MAVWVSSGGGSAVLTNGRAHRQPCTAGLRQPGARCSCCHSHCPFAFTACGNAGKLTASPARLPCIRISCDKPCITQLLHGAICNWSSVILDSARFAVWLGTRLWHTACDQTCQLTCCRRGAAVAGAGPGARQLCCQGARRRDAELAHPVRGPPRCYTGDTWRPASAAGFCCRRASRAPGKQQRTDASLLPCRMR